MRLYAIDFFGSNGSRKAEYVMAFNELSAKVKAESNFAFFLKSRPDLERVQWTVCPPRALTGMLEERI